ncbi:hypothetical protein FRC04_003368 [Tulasnella sp. 424]|nr:hypothetical protein FRC04_003368 [Tulasnella sp. 424]
MLFGGDLAEVEEFRAVRWKGMDWTDFHCHKLKVLEIDNYSLLDMETLFGILAENLDLRILRINLITFRQYTHPPQDRIPLILSHLTHFEFTNITSCHPDVATRPIPCVYLLLGRKRIMEYHQTTPEDLFHIIPRPIDIFTRGGSVRTSRLPYVRITSSSHDFHCQAIGTCFQYRILLRGVPLNVGSRWIRRELADAWTETTKPELQLHRWVDEVTCKLDDIFYLQDLENVAKLDVTGNFHARDPLGTALTKRLQTPVISESGTVIRPFPGLRTLRLDCCAITETDVLRMVEERSGQITSPPGPNEQGSEGGEASVSTEEGITIISGAVMSKIPRSIAREICAVPEVKDLRLDSDCSMENDASSLCSSEESDWSPQILDDDNEVDMIAGSDHDELGTLEESEGLGAE